MRLVESFPEQSSFCNKVPSASSCGLFIARKGIWSQCHILLLGTTRILLKYTQIARQPSSEAKQPGSQACRQHTRIKYVDFSFVFKAKLDFDQTKSIWQFPFSPELRLSWSSVYQGTSYALAFPLCIFYSLFPMILSCSNDPKVEA